MAKNVGRLAGLAALGAAAYMMSKGKDKEVESSGSTTAARPKSTETGRDESPTADDKTKSNVLSAITKPRDKSNDAAGNDGVISAPVNKSNAETRSLSTKVDDDKKADESVKEVKGGDPSQSKGVLRSDKDMTQAEAKTILNQTPADKAKQAAQDKKDIASNKADFRAYQRNLDVTKVANLKSNAELQARKTDARKASISTDEMKNRSRAQARKSSLSPVDQIPGQSRSGPTGGERVSGTELSRNVSNTLSALTPLGGGLGKIGAELATTNRAQRAYNAAQAERRAAEGMSPAEALAAKQAAVQAAREAKTLNPNAWLAGPKGMAENFRKGGAVKKMASGGMTASKRADGIASRGKTRCKMY